VEVSLEGRPRNKKAAEMPTAASRKDTGFYSAAVTSHSVGPASQGSKWSH
jgi:hypothetical protein